MLNFSEIKVEYQCHPLDVDTKYPAFSWKMVSDQNNTVQTSYHIIVTCLKSAENEVIVWDSGLVESDRSIHVIYDGKELQPKTHYNVIVEINDNHGEHATAFTWFETSLFSPDNMKAHWITHAFEDDLKPCAVFTKSFSLPKEIKRARIYATALGTYEFKLNGKKVSDILLAPGWTAYSERLQYQTYDVTKLLNENNTIEMTVANGWYKGIIGFSRQGCHYGNRTAALMQIDVDYSDGTSEQIISDESWMCTTGPIRFSEWYNGQVIDYTYEGQESVPVKLYDYTKDILVAQQCEPVRVVKRFPVKDLIITPKGEVVLDFGQNMAGIVEVKICAPRGTKIVLHHAERLDEHGNMFTENLRTADPTDVFICSGGNDVFFPSFTGHGFQYVQVEGLGKDIDISCFTACATHTDYESTGNFWSSNEDITKLWNNIDWTMRSNSVDIPTDCPQRDERMGYTGDVQAFIPTATILKNSARFFRKWLQDLKVDQREDGAVPMLTPMYAKKGSWGGHGTSIWHDASLIVPWALYKAYGDIRFLSDQYDSMKAAVEYSKIRADESGLRLSGHEQGDWVSIDGPKGPLRKIPEGILVPAGEEQSGGTDRYYVANVYYANSVWILCETAKLLGFKDDVNEYAALYDDIIAKIRNHYFTPDGRMVSETQTSCALALNFNIMEERFREQTLAKLLNRLDRHSNHLVSGFFGTAYICSMLSDHGEHALAGKIVLKEDCPSWLYAIRMGATTIWELWDGVNEDGSINRFEMNSFNQFGFASVGNWLHTRLAGISYLEPGYKKSRIAPRLVTRIPEVKASIETVYGNLSCNISCRNNKYIVDIHVPENTTAIISLPEKEEFEVGSGFYHYEYETESVFDLPKYNKELTVGDFLKHPIAIKMINEEMPDIMKDIPFRAFCKNIELGNLKGAQPEERLELFDRILEAMNAEG